MAEKPTQVLEAFAAQSEAILAEWTKRQDSPPRRRAESPNAWFKREAYALLTQYIQNGQMYVFNHFTALDKRSNRSVEEAAKNPFKLGLMAMISIDEDFSRSDRHVFGNQMLYAWIHDVPPDFLNAFLAITGGPGKVAEKLKLRQAEPGFEHRFDQRRLLPL